MRLQIFERKNQVSRLMAEHFRTVPVHHLIAVGRTFPIASRVDLQAALDTLFRERYPARVIGIHPEFLHETLGVAHLSTQGHQPILIGPLQHDEIDTGETAPARCLKHGLWLGRTEGLSFAVLMTPANHFGQVTGTHLELAVPPGDTGAAFSRAFFDEVERLVSRAGSYRGKVLSLEAGHRYTGRVGDVKVLRLPPVAREQVILPEKTLQLLERNVHEFVRQRDRLRGLGLAAKKGLLFYGPPGTGKTHTICYLASQLRDHTTLLITAEQVGLLDEYFRLARFLQPAMVVIEDVDLIARAREELRSACEESLLNKLLNEMDGLREDAQVLFVLTTNHPDQLERALASRPGRIDQAIEFPLPDDEGRRQLVRLYSRGLTVPEVVVENIVGRTKKASPAFIKELMRRSAQYQLQAGQDTSLTLQHVEAALDEMLFSGGTLNVRLLGGAVEA
jgi:hypothetical protein